MIIIKLKPYEKTDLIRMVENEKSKYIHLMNIGKINEERYVYETKRLRNLEERLNGKFEDSTLEDIIKGDILWEI